MEAKPLQKAVYHATEVAAESGFIPAHVRVEVLAEGARKV